VLLEQRTIEFSKDGRVDAQHPSPRGELVGCERFGLGRVVELAGGFGASQAKLLDLRK
jgi:hypothetical protein